MDALCLSLTVTVLRANNNAPMSCVRLVHSHKSQRWDDTLRASGPESVFAQYMLRRPQRLDFSQPQAIVRPIPARAVPALALFRRVTRRRVAAPILVRSRRYSRAQAGLFPGATVWMRLPVMSIIYTSPFCENASQLPSGEKIGLKPAISRWTFVPALSIT